MAVKIVAEVTKPSSADEDFVRVRAHTDPSDETVTLATIERVVERCGRAEDESGGAQWHIKTLVLDQPMSLDAAVGLAARYAERKGIPVVYAAPDGLRAVQHAGTL
jgi:hypothetical protein